MPRHFISSPIFRGAVGFEFGRRNRDELIQDKKYRAKSSRWN